MARKEAPLYTFMLTQALQPEYWNWDANENVAISNEDHDKICEIIKLRLEKVGLTVNAMHSIVHDKDVHKVYDSTVDGLVVDYKTHHIHSLIVLGGNGSSVDEVALCLGVEPQFIEKKKAGRYGYDNMLSYLIHAKEDPEVKHHYEPTDVITSVGEDYRGIYLQRKLDWSKGAAKKKAAKVKVDVDWLETEILEGRITDRRIISLTDEYYDIYARNKKRINDAFDTYFERKIYRTMDAMDRGDFKVSVFYVTGKSHSGKSHFTDDLVESIIQGAKKVLGENWSSCSSAASNPFDDYEGQEILVMDDLRGSALTASDWLKLLDPDRINICSARYSNRTMACRVIIINSERDLLEFFYYMKGNVGTDGGRSEAMDQFIRRILAKVTVYKVPDSEERRLSIGAMVEKATGFLINAPSTTGEKMMLKHTFRGYEDMDYNDSLSFLTNWVMYNNQLNVDGVVPPSFPLRLGRYFESINS